MGETANLKQAISSWKKAIGEKSVVTDAFTLQRFGTATFATETKIAAILRPASREQVQACMRVANQFKTAVYPSSTGLNWGYGSRVPVKGSVVVLDLSSMKRILELNEEMAYAVIEPGVTQQELSDYLKKATEDRLWMDATGASPHSSVIGNTMERGHGLTPFGDHVAEACSYEVVLPNGECVTTGPAMFANSSIQHLDRWQLGPGLDGLFSQSNFGIVTRMTVWLMRAPESYTVLTYAMENDAKFSSVVDCMRELRLSGVVQGIPHFGNGLFSLSRRMSFPWQVTGGITPLDRAQTKAWLQKNDVSEWNGMVGLYGTREQVELAKRLVTGALSAHCLRVQATYPQDLEGDLHQANDTYKRDMKLILKHLGGGTSGTGVKRLYWRKADRTADTPDQAQPEADRCGIVAVPLTFPFQGVRASHISTKVADTFVRNGFDPLISMVGVRPRILQMHAFICYDRDQAGDDQRAEKCQQEVFDELSREGVYPHRLGINSMNLMRRSETGYLEILGKLKQAFDPNSVLAPGRYIPNGDSSE